jgi:TRAP-type transport system periplasmic protein
MGAMFRSALIITAIAALAATGCDGSDANKLGATKQTKAKILTVANGNSGPPAELEYFSRALARVSEGRLRIEFRNKWRYGEANTELDLLRDVAAGKADLGWVGSRALGPLGLPEFDALQAPLLIDSYELEERVVGSDIVRDMLGRVDSLGVEPVGLLPGPLQYLLTTTPVSVPADLSGNVIGYFGFQNGARALEALGARPRPIGAGFEHYGELDGSVEHTDALIGSGFLGKAKYLAANLAFWPRPLVLVASPRVDAEDLELLRRAASEASTRVRGPAEQRERDQTEALCRAGVQLHQVDLAAMERAVRPVYDRLESDPGTRRVVESIQTIASDLKAPRSVLSCAAASRPTSGTLPIGTYEVTITPAEMRAAGWKGPDTEIPRRFTLQITPDEFIHRDIANAEIGIQGTYSVFRDRFVANGTNGDKLTAHWEADGDELRFTDMTVRPIGGGPAETDSPYSLVWTTHPWRRVR